MNFPVDIASLKQAYESGALTPRDVINAIYDKIAEDGEQPVWISLRSREDALQKAASAPQGPLFGIPFAVKDNIDVAGLPTTCACPEFAYTPPRSATVVELLEAAGAIAIGKTNLDQFATGLVGTRSPYGIPRNTFNPDYISGGSSSGSAVTVARGLVSFALGTDTAGSGRVPAAFNNIVGLKPSKGLISTRGVVPACRTQDTVSVFAATVADAWQVFSLVSVYDAEDDYARLPAARSVAPQPAVGIRIGVPNQPLEFFGDQAAERLYARSIETAKILGHEIVSIDFSPFADAAKLLYQGPWVAERLAAIRDFATAKPEAIHDAVRGIILGANAISAADAFDGFYRLAALTRLAEREWSKMDVMLLPTTPTIYTIEQLLAEPIRLNSNLGLYTNFVNLMDLSALAVPAGFKDDGLPSGVTLIGRACCDRQLAELGDLLHRANGDTLLGATEQRLDATPALSPLLSTDRMVRVAVVGAHLSGQPLNVQLTERNARLAQPARTAAGYSFYALSNTKPLKPGLIFDGEGAGKIEVEIWEMPEAAFGSFVALIPSPLGIGTLQLEDGSAVKGFLCEPHAVADAQDITSYGGWRAWLATQN